MYSRKHYTTAPSVVNSTIYVQASFRIQIMTEGFFRLINFNRQDQFQVLMHIHPTPKKPKN